MTTLQSEHYQLWKITVCLFAAFSTPAALNLNLTFAEQIKYMNWECVAVIKAQVPSFSGGRVQGGFATHRPCQSLLLRFTF